MVDKWSSHVRTEKTLFRLAHKTMKKRKAKETKKKKKWEKQAKSAFYDTLSIFPREPANSSFRIFLKAIPSPLPPPHVLPFPSLSLFFSLFLSFVLFLFKVYSTKKNGPRDVWHTSRMKTRDIQPERWHPIPEFVDPIE